MRKYIKNLKSNLLIVCLLLICFVSCKKDKTEKPDENEEPATENEVILNQSSGTPGDLVTIKTTQVQSKESWQIMVGGKPVNLVRASGSTAVFYVPYIPSGSVKINLSSVGIPTPLDFTVSKYTPISNPEVVFADFETMIGEEISANTYPEVTKALTSLRDNLNAGYKKLTEQEKKELAFQIQKFTIDVSFKPATTGKISFAGNTIMNNPVKSLLGIEVISDIDTDEEYVETVIQCGGLLVLYGSTVVLGATMFSSPTGITQVTGLATLVYSQYVLGRYLVCRRALQLYRGENHDIKSFTIIDAVINKIIPVDKINSINSARISAVNVLVNPTTDMVLSKNYSYTLDVKGGFGSFSSNSKSGVTQKLVNSIKTLSGVYNLTIAKLNSIKSWFVSTPDFPLLSDDIPNTSDEEVKNCMVKNLKIEKISDPAITITQTGTGSNLVLTASSKSVAVEKSFTFDIVYQNPGLGITNRKSVNAIYDPNVYPSKIEISSGNNQQAEPGKKLSNPLKIIAKDTNGQGLEGVIVEWKVKSGNGILTVLNSTTDINGIAQTEWTLGTSGRQEVETIVKKRDGSPVSGSPLVFRTLGVNLIGKWKVTSDIWKVYNSAGSFQRTDIGDPFDIEFSASNVVKLYNPRFTDEDTGTYVLDPSGQFVTISGTDGDDYIFKYYISDVTADGMVLTTDKVYGYFSGAGYGILELKLKK